jgi:hypothetical protein
MVDEELALDVEDSELLELMVGPTADTDDEEDSPDVVVEENEAEAAVGPSGTVRRVLPENDPEVDELLRGSSVCDGDVCGWVNPYSNDEAASPETRRKFQNEQEIHQEEWHRRPDSRFGSLNGSSVDWPFSSKYRSVSPASSRYRTTSPIDEDISCPNSPSYSPTSPRYSRDDPNGPANSPDNGPDRSGILDSPDYSPRTPLEDPDNKDWQSQHMNPTYQSPVPSPDSPKDSGKEQSEESPADEDSDSGSYGEEEKEKDSPVDGKSVEAEKEKPSHLVLVSCQRGCRFW